MNEQEESKREGGRQEESARKGGRERDDKQQSKRRRRDGFHFAFLLVLVPVQ